APFPRSTLVAPGDLRETCPTRPRATKVPRPGATPRPAWTYPERLRASHLRRVPTDEAPRPCPDDRPARIPPLARAARGARGAPVDRPGLRVLGLQEPPRRALRREPHPDRGDLLDRDRHARAVRRGGRALGRPSRTAQGDRAVRVLLGLGLPHRCARREPRPAVGRLPRLRFHR